MKLIFGSAILRKVVVHLQPSEVNPLSQTTGKSQKTQNDRKNQKVANDFLI